mmetsp:Transcript_19194/g.49575  ORF Transcript_19194/g.49575 Transcript_19194/m.49575 type:complete len:214 (+) Transcript_19194:423-1064(+)
MLASTGEGAWGGVLSLTPPGPAPSSSSSSPSPSSPKMASSSKSSAARCGLPVCSTLDGTSSGADAAGVSSAAGVVGPTPSLPSVSVAPTEVPITMVWVGRWREAPRVPNTRPVASPTASVVAREGSGGRCGSKQKKGRALIKRSTSSAGSTASAHSGCLHAQSTARTAARKRGGNRGCVSHDHTSGCSASSGSSLSDAGLGWRSGANCTGCKS